MPEKKDIRICKKCRKQFEYKSESVLPKDIEYCYQCRGDKYSATAAKIAKAIESLLK
ncbi:MAG: hypothetical protein ACOZCL_05125 [Bacillota bacterium]